MLIRQEPHIVLTLDTKEPIELGAFVGAFTSLGNEYERYIKRTNPDLAGEVEMYVREVRPGSIIADLVPYLSLAVPFVDDMSKMLVVDQFIKVWGGRFQSLLSLHGKDAPETRSELKDWADAVQAIATDPSATGTIEAATFEDGKKKVRAAFKFSSQEARKALETIETKQRRLEKSQNVDHRRVLMVFTRTDVGDAAVGKPSGERVRIDEISERALALVYASELAEQRIKHEIRDTDDNIYKKGFVVDVNVRSNAGRPVAYAVTHVHQVVELPD